MAERVKSGRTSLEVVKDLLSRIPNDFGRRELLHCLRVHFPNESWDDDPTMFRKPRDTSSLQHALWDEEEKVEKHLAELRAKIGGGTTTYHDRLEEFLLAAELAANHPIPYYDPVGQHLREQENEAMLWVLDLLARPIRAKGKALTPMKPHEAAVVKSGHWRHDGPEVSRPGGIGALLDIASFD
jgi:hypothetical protein